MVQTRRRTSLIGVVALFIALAALVLARINPTGVETVSIGPLVLRLATFAALLGGLLAVLAFLSSASSRRTGAGLPLLSLLICGCALVLAFKPDLFKRPPPAPPAKPAAAGAKSAAPAPAVSSEGDEHRVKTIFDFDEPASAPPGRGNSAGSGEHAVAAPIPPPAAAARADPTAAVRAARAKLDAARAKVVVALQSTPAFQSAQEDANAADEQLKKARPAYPPGSSELIAISRAALAARDKVQAMVSDAAIRDSAYRDAALELHDAETGRK
jgi:hypothetical protein